MTRSQSVALLGEAPSRAWVTPQGVRASSADDVVDLSASFGLYLDGWQQQVLTAAQGERADGTWAAQRVGVTVPRQNGKSQLMVARILAGALLFGEKKIVVSAHQQDTAREAFAKLMELIEADDNVALRLRVKAVMNALNREAVTFTTGAKVQFKARSGAGGKGFSSDCLLLDEAQILGSRAWTSINSTMSAMPNPQVWLLGTTPQEEDDSFAFDAVRRAALAGKSTNAAWCEWGVNVDSDEYRAAQADLAAKKWTPAVEYLCWSANPAWLTRMNHEVVQGEFETYDPSKFAEDRLGIWRDDTAGQLIMPRWPELVAPRPKDAPVVALGVAADVDHAWISLGAVLGGERPHLGSVNRWPTRERAKAVAEIARIQSEQGVPVVVDGGGPASTVIAYLEAAGVIVTRLDLPGYVQACDDLVQAVDAGAVEHGGYDELDAAVAAAGWRQIGDRRAFARKGGDISALEACACALSATREEANYDVMSSIL
ncbi:terminase large subunit domain-containing protein [Isoptericola variabilis]